MPSTTTGTSAVDLNELRALMQGRVISPDDAEYDSARRVMVGGIDRRPAAVVRVANAVDVQRLVAYARDNGHELAVRSGGHSAAGYSTVDDGIVLDLGAMKAIEIDVEGRTAWAETGLTAGEYSTETGKHGLATGFGDTGSVGIGGITLGGGVGYLGRAHGLTIDNLLAADVVTADGQLRRVDADTNPDLFWAIRGGGGNVGVATRFQFRLHPVDPFVGGMLILPATAEAIAGFVAAAAAAPETLSTIGNVMPCPPMPFVPESEHGRIVMMGILANVGDAEAGAEAIAPFRALATPIADLVKLMPYPEIYPPEDPDYHPLAINRNLFLKRIDREVAGTIVEFLAASDATMRVAQIRVLGGAMARVPAEATAYAHRSSPIMVNVASFYEGPDDKPKREDWVERFAAALDQGDSGAYVNFVGDEGEARVHAAYPGRTWVRLAEIKRRYDPDNLFHLNQNVPPASV